MFSLLPCDFGVLDKSKFGSFFLDGMYWGNCILYQINYNIQLLKYKERTTLWQKEHDRHVAGHVTTLLQLCSSSSVLFTSGRSFGLYGMSDRQQTFPLVRLLWNIRTPSPKFGELLWIAHFIWMIHETTSPTEWTIKKSPPKSALVFLCANIEGWTWASDFGCFNKYLLWPPARRGGHNS